MLHCWLILGIGNMDVETIITPLPTTNPVWLVVRKSAEGAVRVYRVFDHMPPNTVVLSEDTSVLIEVHELQLNYYEEQEFNG
jgi:hypothetical protein